MKLIELKCPNCGADIQVDEGRSYCFCTYCGAKAMIDDGATRIIDEAKIREAEAMEKIKLAEANLEMEKFKAEQEEKRKNDVYWAWCTVISILLIIGILAFTYYMNN